jgi:hypothetical protein
MQQKKFTERLPVRFGAAYVSASWRPRNERTGTEDQQHEDTQQCPEVRNPRSLLWPSRYRTGGVASAIACIAAGNVSGAWRLRGRNLELVEHRVLKRLWQQASSLSPSPRRDHWGTPSRGPRADIGLLFRTLAPMRSRDNMRAKKESSRWPRRSCLLARYGHAPEEPRRVFTALRFLLTEPKHKKNYDE